MRYLKGAPSAKSLIVITTPSKFVNVYTDSDWAGQATTCKSTSGGVVQWGNATLTAWSRTQHTVSLSSAEAELYALTTGVAEGMVTKHLMQELGHEVGDNSDEFGIFRFSKRIWLTVTSQSIRSLRHWHCHDCTRNWSRQGESDCLNILWNKQVILRSIFRSMHCVSDLCESVE